MDDLFEKLKALGLKVERASEIEPEIVENTPLDQVVDGAWLDEITRGVYKVDKSLPLGARHGAVSFFPPQEMDHLQQFTGIETDLAAEKILFLDTETSSLSTGAGSFVFMVGMSYFTETGIKTIQLFLEKPENELEFLCHFDDFIKDFDTFVSYNGKAFDIPMLRSRYIMKRLPHSLDSFGHVDLLHIARRIWKLRLESRRLSDIEKEILSFSRSEDEIPGWLVPQIYFDYLESRDAVPLKGVFYHNEMDVVSLAALFIHINRLLSGSEIKIQSDGLDAYSIGNVFGKMGNLELSRDFLKAGMEQGLPHELKIAAARCYADTFKKQGEWTEALEYWKFAAESDDFLSCLELAKYYEHRQKDIQSALQWVERAFLLVNDKYHDLPALERRKARLEKKSEMKHHEKC